MELITRSFYFEGALGLPRGNFFVNGLVTLLIDNKRTLKAEYFDIRVQMLDKRLNGLYKNNNSFSADLGLAFGIHKDPIFLIGKLTYPVIGPEGIFEDRNPEKITEGTEIFPKDFIPFVNQENYEALQEDFRGLMISLTLVVAIPL